MDIDLEKKSANPPKGGVLDSDYGQVIASNQTMFQRVVHSFRQNHEARVSEVLLDESGKPLPHQPPAQPALAHKLKERHMQMIAIGGSIGRFATPFPILHHTRPSPSRSLLGHR